MLGITLWVIIYEPNVHDFFLKNKFLWIFNENKISNIFIVKVVKHEIACDQPSFLKIQSKVVFLIERGGEGLRLCKKKVITQYHSN